MPAAPLHQVLVVDDDPEFRTLVRTFLAGSDFSLSEAVDGVAALHLMKHRRFDALIVDIVMPEGEGLETIREVHRLYPDCRILVTSGASFRDVYFQSARLLGAQWILEKPVSREQLYAGLNRLACRPRC